MADKTATKKPKADQTTNKGKKKIAYYTGVEVNDFDGNTFTINSTNSGPLRVEICHMSHPAYNPDKKITKKAKGHMEKFLEKQKKMAGMKKE